MKKSEDYVYISKQSTSHIKKGVEWLQSFISFALEARAALKITYFHWIEKNIKQIFFKFHDI